MVFKLFNPFSANSTKWSNTRKQFVGNLPTNWLSVFDHFVKLALKGLRMNSLTFRYWGSTVVVLLVALYKIKKANYKTFYTYIFVPEYVRELFFKKHHVQSKSMSALVLKEVTIFFPR